MTDLVLGPEPTTALLKSLLVELKYRDSHAAHRLRGRIETMLADRQEQSSPGSGRQGYAGAQGGNRGQGENGFRANRAPGQAEYNEFLRRYERLESDHHVLRKRHVDDLAAARARQIELKAAVSRLRSSMNGHTDPLYSKVYLTPNAPRWLILDVQRAFRVRYHPDKHGIIARSHQAPG